MSFYALLSNIILRLALAVPEKYEYEKREMERQVDAAVQQASDPSLWGGVGYVATIIGAFILLILAVFLIFMFWRR